MTTDVNPRYVAYAEAHGRTADAQLAHDRQRWPGGVMTGFILWLDERWAEWRRSVSVDRDAYLSDADHVAFDAWLTDWQPHG